MDEIVHDESSHVPGNDLAAINRKLDSFGAQYQNQLADQEASTTRCTKYASQLADGGVAGNFDKSAEALDAKFNQIKNDAATYAETLDAARAREVQLVSTHKAFNEKKSRVMEWCDSSHGLISLNEQGNPIGLEQSCGLATVENKVDAFQAEIKLQQQVMHTLVAEMEVLSGTLTEGLHADASAVAEQQVARKADIEELNALAEDYEEKLNAALAREQHLVDTQKR